MSDRVIEYMPLGELKPAKRNPKLHAVEDLDASIGRFGFTEPILMDERTGRLVAGHGRLEALKRAEKKGGEPPPGVATRDNVWMVPVVRGWSSADDKEAEAYLLSSNRLVEVGGWDDEQLAEILQGIAEAGPLDGIGWTPAEVEKILGWGDQGDLYTTRVEAPIYKPTGPKPPVSSLADGSKFQELLKEIMATQGLSDDERGFLLQAAQRHVVYDYQAIAEFYAHASAPVQRLMEKSALVIIDFKQAIEGGFVKLTKDLSEDFLDVTT